MFDVLIVGAGPAGLSAALMLGRCRRRVLLCDGGKPRNASSSAMHGFLTRDGIAPAEFLRLGHEQLRPYTNVEDRALAVVDVARQNNIFTVLLSDRTSAATRTLLLATGLAETLPPIQGIETFYGKSVFSCPYCHGWEVRDQPFAVYAKGRQAVIMCLQLTTWSRDLVLCTDGPSELNEQERAILTQHSILLREERIAHLQGTEGQLEQIVFSNGTALPRRVLFCPVNLQQTELLGKLGCTLPTPTSPNALQQPIAPGIYMAGDAFYSRWVSGASAAGAEVAVMLHTALLDEDLTKERMQRAPLLQGQS
jgi:thioredoxin reductase